jgi:hypothetical protein
MKRLTTSSSAFYYKGVDKDEISGQIHFLLCQECFWCASFIGTHERMITHCPSCNSVRLESMPISEKEPYPFDYHPTRGITLEFLKIAGYSGLGCPIALTSPSL